MGKTLVLRKKIYGRRPTHTALFAVLFSLPGCHPLPPAQGFRRRDDIEEEMMMGFRRKESREKRIQRTGHHQFGDLRVELSPGNPSQASRAGRDRDRSSPNCPSDYMSELSENSD